MHNPNVDSDYDVFLSSKTGDTDKESFTSHLYTSLQKARISVFWDHDDGLLSGGEQISPSVVQVIQRSRISVVVLSAGYAGSRRCLDVLEQIIERHRIAGQFVLPVFLGMSRYDVRDLQRGFREAFGDLTNRILDKDKVGSWKLCFARICQIQYFIHVELSKEPSSSRSIDGNKRWWSDNEVEGVVECAKNLVDRTDLFVAEHLEGIARRARFIPVPYFINQKPEGVLLWGIWGMVGIGKTTLAKAIYNHNRKDFEGISFLAGIREVWNQDTGPVYLQERLLSDVYKLPREKIESIEIGKKILEEKLSHKKILLVLDDVNKLEQLNALCGSREWFGPGSMIIITTRDRSLLKVHGVEHEHVFNMKEMDNKLSGDLIRWYAGRDVHQLSKNIVAYTGGLPLALEVLGSNIFVSESPGAIFGRLQESPDPVVLKVLKSYINDLPNIERDIFLDIACFLIGMDRVKVIETLNAFGDLAEKGISALEDNGLVTFDTESKVAGMNVLLRETGREIIRELMRVKPDVMPGPWIYDVFFSFNGKDTWATFTPHLYAHLANANINFFKKDDDETRRGEWISISQLQAIGRSRVCVVVLSKHYANSRWCLQELEKIMECHKTIGQMVVPIFYGVDRSAVHNQTDDFGESFQDLLKTISVESDKKERWRIMLGEIGNIAAGIEIPVNSRNEGEDIKNVIEHVTHSLDIMFVVEHPVGLKARVQDVILLLNCKKSKDVLLLGIWGMGGSGKTTIAKSIYNIIGRVRKYEVRSLLQNISKDWKQDNGQLYLQEKLLSDINNGTKIKIDDVESGRELLIERLRHERILLVLDDVDKLEQLNVLCASRQWFGSDSMIIITTRDKHLLDELGVDHVYRMKDMDESESAILFCWHAFKQPSPRKYFEGLSRDAVACCGGLPLALVELGLELFRKDESEWASRLGNYKRSPHPMIQQVLKSFDDLNGKEKDMFIDIALFFIGMNREEAIWRLNASGDLDEKGLSALEDQFLVTVDVKNKLRMHVLLQNKGKEIIREQMPVEFGAWIYDVFVSFEGEECATFTSHLCTCLANAKINFIKDDDKIRRRDRIISLLQEIGKCRISIVVLSRDYANSRWCLQELEKIMKCHKAIGQVVVPVFYGVDPSTVRNQRGQFGEAFQDLLTRFSVESDKENNWRAALWQIGSIAGIVITESWKGDENLKNVMEHVTHSLDMFVVEHPVGLKDWVQDVIQLLNCKMSKDILLLGIWGMGGSGKTTLAKAIYNILSRKYEGRSFLQDISDLWKQDNGRVCLQGKLLSDINTTTNVKKDDMKPGKRILCERLCHERILLVLDDVDDLEQLNALCGSREWFGSDSIIIITTRDERLLNELGVGHVYRMKEMDESESTMLLSWHAFKQPSPRQDFVGLCRDVVAHCGGLPLALEVLGCELFGKDESEWKSLMHRYKRIPHPTIQNVLKRSFDGLGDDRVKNVFLEIACFFVGLDQNEVIQKLNGFGDHLAARSVPVFVEQSLVIVDETNRLGMHVLLQHMAREIFRQRSRMPSNYDVFFSFSSIDTPSSFTSGLIGSLEKAGISVFRSDNLFTGGDHISPSLLRVIQRCRISVVVLSTGYARSRRCLELLEQIIECRRIAGQFVLPVFLGIFCYDLYRRGGFRETFGDLTKRFSDKDKVESWTIALARISGDEGYNMFHYWHNNNEHIENIKEIVKHAIGLLDSTDLFVVKYPVGVETRVRDACQLLIHQKDKDVLLLGIWGMVGIGKTVIAKAIYNQIGANFEGRSFLANIREIWEQDRRHVYLQELLLSGVFKLPIIKIDSVRVGKKILKNKFSHKRLLLVLDDVNKLEQLDALCGSREWFGPGSVIIITTRDRSLLTALGVDHVYRIKEMDERESLQLLDKWSSGSNQLLSNQIKQKLVASVGGLPLALEVEVLASGMFDRFKEFPHTVVQKVIKTCINDLNDTEKCIFFDMACFLNGMDHEEAMEALNAFELANDLIRALEDRCFVTIDEMNRLKMHVILRDMGRKIIHEQMKVKPESWIYDVFLSFRGNDTRKIFSSSLHASLANAGIHVFKDDNELRRGDRISISLLQAIRRSRISIVVLSRHYADSRWCLQELEYIMECRRTIGQVVLPVFYDVDPSSVRSQMHMFGEAFQNLLKKFAVEKDKEKEKSWRTALHDIGSIAGIEIIKFRDNNEGINQIVEDIIRWLDKSTFIVAEHPVGLESHVQSVIKLLHYQQSKDVQLLGISGIGGIGKTTIAKAIYNQIRHDFDGSCFLLDIREFWKEMTSRLHLQEQILFDVLKKRERINNIESGKIILRERLHHKRVLLILDDVDKSDQLKALCWSREWFGSGSRIIITTRDDRLLKVLKVDHKYKMLEMDNEESIEHFSWHAFKQASPKEDFAELSRDVVAYCGGLPLALEVIGSLLLDENAEIWWSVLDKLKTIPNAEVQKKLRVSFDGLGDDIDREMFLDIAFFFIGMDKNDVMHILDGYHPEIGISNLIDRNLVSVDKNNKLRMHYLLRDMGRQIVREESLKKPEKRSRLWLQEDVLEVLQNHTGINNSVEGLTLKLTGINTICLKTEVFRKMPRLRLLQLAGVQLDGDFEYHHSHKLGRGFEYRYSHKLRWLYWHGYPLDYITTPYFYRGSLVALELEYSNLVLIRSNETQFLEKLKVLNLSHSHRLTQTPDFSCLPNLEKLLLKDCPSLSVVSKTIGDLKKIILINLENCTRLPNLPRSFYKLKSLDTLIISGCSMIDKLEEDVEQMESLITLLADNTGIKQVPFSMVRSKSIGYISMCGYDGFSRDVFPSLIWSWMSPTNILSFSSFVQSSFVGLALVSLNVPKFGSLCWVRSGSDHKQGLIRILNTLDATYCKVSNIRTSLTEVGMKSQVTNILREIILQKLTSNGPEDCLLPSDNYPASFSFNCEDSSVIFEVPHMNGCNLKTMFHIVYSSPPDSIISECLKTVSIKNYAKSTIQVYKRDTLASFENEEWQSLLSNLDPGNWVEVSRYRFIVKKTTVYPISDAPTDQNMKQQEVAFVSCGTDSGGDENVKDLEKRKSKRKPTSTTNSGVSPKAPKSLKITSMIFNATIKDLTTSPERSLTSKVATLIQGSSHEDQALQEKTHATDQLPYIELVSTTDGALIENSTITPFVVGEETPREPPVVGNSIIPTPPNLLLNTPVVESNMGRIEGALARTLKEMDSDDIFAELEKVLGGETSPTKASPAGSKAASVDINPAIKVLHECYEIIEGKDLKSLSTNEDLMCKLTDKLTELAPIRSHLPPLFKEMATKLERLYKDILDHFIPTTQVLDQHRSLLDSKSKVLEDLSSLKKRKLDLAASTTEINMSLDDVARKRAKLEKERKLLVERENDLNFSKEQSKVALDELKQELSFKLEEGKKIFEELPMVEAAAKEAEITQQSLSKQLEDVQQSLKITKA